MEKRPTASVYGIRASILDIPIRREETHAPPFVHDIVSGCLTTGYMETTIWNIWDVSVADVASHGAS